MQVLAYCLHVNYELQKWAFLNDVRYLLVSGGAEQVISPVFVQ
jgi:hypothetical protein